MSNLAMAFYMLNGLRMYLKLYNYMVENMFKTQSPFNECMKLAFYSATEGMIYTFEN